MSKLNRLIPAISLALTCGSTDQGINQEPETTTIELAENSMGPIPVSLECENIRAELAALGLDDIQCEQRREYAIFRVHSATFNGVEFGFVVPYEGLHAYPFIPKWNTQLKLPILGGGPQSRLTGVIEVLSGFENMDTEEAHSRAICFNTWKYLIRLEPSASESIPMDCFFRSGNIISGHGINGWSMILDYRNGEYQADLQPPGPILDTPSQIIRDSDHDLFMKKVGEKIFPDAAPILGFE